VPRRLIFTTQFFIIINQNGDVKFRESMYLRRAIEETSRKSVQCELPKYGSTGESILTEVCRPRRVSSRQSPASQGKAPVSVPEWLIRDL
jgi:hypothetical protein